MLTSRLLTTAALLLPLHHCGKLLNWLHSRRLKLLSTALAAPVAAASRPVSDLLLWPKQIYFESAEFCVHCESDIELELGVGFASVGSQYRLQMGGEEF